MATKPLNTLQAGRGLAALAVLLYHANLTLSLPKYLGYEVAPVFRSGDSGVQFFFVLSGFVILLAHESDIGKPAQLGSFLSKRFRRVYPPLWIVLLLVIPIFFLHPSFGIGDERKFATIVGAFLIAPIGSNSLLAPEWTLRHEIVFYGVFALLLWRRRAGYLVLGLWLLACAVVPFLHPDPTGLPAFFFASNHLLFGFGMLVCVIFRRVVLGVGVTWLCAAAGILLYAAAWAAEAYRPALLWNDPAVLFGFAAALAILGLISLERAGHLSFPWALTYLGEASYAVYLIHYPVISLMCKVVARNRLWAHGALCFLTVSVAALAVGILFHALLEKPVTAYLSGHRKLGTIPTTG